MVKEVWSESQECKNLALHFLQTRHLNHPWRGQKTSKKP
jgi:hypothetical protein